jgi:hypothetical protein
MATKKTRARSQVFCACGCGNKLPVGRELYFDDKHGARVRAWRSRRLRDASRVRDVEAPICPVCELPFERPPPGHAGSNKKYHDWCAPTARKVRRELIGADVPARPASAGSVRTRKARGSA